ncbi:MAG: hypothetical protein KBA31_00705 [Alphaproteobacteria bacterium]|nr:hypothetical protein [Alphaproteobacteria bacterium]
MPGELHVFGIRHHGPGSAFSLERALDSLDPATVLIEGPPEANDLIRHMADTAMRPPVALLVYAADDPATANFYPFAEFSPEWRACLWALKRGRPVRFIDMPAEHTLARRKAIDEEPRGKTPTEQPDEPVDDIERDPLTALARAAGRDDGESWWNDLIEETEGTVPLFAAIESAMAALRDKVPARHDHDWNEKREAHMRLAICETLRMTDGKVAAVVGAWHAPALTAKRTALEDRAQIKGLPKVKATATWALWSEPRLAAASGYGAGVISPRWYRHLWNDMIERGAGKRDGRRLIARWLTQAAHLMREGGQLAAPASVIEAVRLAETLAILRERSLPGLVELRDAFLTTLAHGEEAVWRVIEQRLVVGTDVGEIPATVPQAPLQADLQREIKRLRLKLEAIDSEASLDLRTDTGQHKSRLFRRLRLINVPWAEPLDAGRSRGTFREKWRLVWQPEFSVRMVEALVWGATIEQAADNAVTARLNDTTDLPVIAEAVRECLFAGLRPAANAALIKLQRTAATSNDVGQLMEAAAPLAETLRYGNARDIPEDDLRKLLVGMGETVCVNLGHACRGLDAEAAGNLARQVNEFNRATTLLEVEALTTDWRLSLGELAHDGATTPLLAGTAVRLLYDASVLDAEGAERRLARALSPSVAPADAGNWLDGFLSGSGHVLLNDQALRNAVDRWLVTVGDEEFVNLLPMLRRAFASFDAMERRRLLDEVRNPSSNAPVTTTAGDGETPGFAKSLPLLKQILGLP